MIATTGDAIAQALDDLRNLDPRHDPQAAAAEIPRYRPETGLRPSFLPKTASRKRRPAALTPGFFKIQRFWPQLGPDTDI